MNISWFCYEPSTPKRTSKIAEERRHIAEALGEDIRIEDTILH